MGLIYGWRAHDERDTIWRGDPSLANVTPGALEDWRKDGDASHLLPYATIGTPDIFTFRILNLEESRWVMGINVTGDMSGFLRQLIACFRIGVTFPNAPETYQRESTGQTNLPKGQRINGIRMLSLPFVEALEAQYEGITGFYGGLIYNATYPSEDEKKASSPSPTPTKSTGDTAAMAKTEGPQGV